MDKSLLWDLIKCKIRGMTISYSSFKAKKQRIQEAELKQKLEELEKNIHLNESLIQDYQTTKREYEHIQNIKSQGLMIRSRAQYIEAGEKNNKYFLGLEKRNQCTKNITCVIDENDLVITDSKLILKQQELFYQKLYTQQTTDLNDPSKIYFLGGINLPKLKLDSQNLCDSPIMMDECKH